MTPPARPEEPRPCRRDRRDDGGLTADGDLTPPSVEPSTGRGGIDEQRVRDPSRMMARVQEDVRKRVPHLARASEQVEMEAFGEHGPAPAGRSVQGPRDSGAERFHPAAECVGVGRLDEQVRVRGLEGVVDETKVFTGPRCGEAPLERAHERDRAQGRKPRTEPYGHVGGEAGGHTFAPTMRHRRRRATPTSRARPTTAPSAFLAQPEIELFGACSHVELD